MSALLSFPSTSTSFWRSPRHFAATTMYSAAINSTNTVQSRTTIATHITRARRSDFPLPPHSLPEKHNSGFLASTLSDSFTKNGMSRTHSVNLLYEMFSTTRFCRPARYWRFPLRTLCSGLSSLNGMRERLSVIHCFQPHMYAQRLAELAVDLGFDGWLVNNLFSLCAY
ncbi:hypothetical protein HKD37_19G053467 [Glycine soja]